jgi:D-alanine transaminase
MSRVAHVNGTYLPHRHARVSIDDRGYQFADAVYEVIAIRGDRLIDAERHLDRLDRSLRELRMASPMSRVALRAVMDEVIRRNMVSDGIIYLQLSRAVAPRDHPFPAKARTQLVMTARRSRPEPEAWAREGVRVITQPEIRWARCDIKSTALLPNVLAKQMARESGAFEAWFVDRDGMVTEGSSTNAWIVDESGQLITRPPSDAILNGVTRQAVVDLARGEQLRLVERPFSLDEARAAREAFLTSTTANVMPVTMIDGHKVGQGGVGEFTRKLRQRYVEANAVSA